MSKSAKYVYSVSPQYAAQFPTTLRMLMEKNGTTQKELATFVGIRPQTLAQYCTGETQPNGDKLLKIAEYYKVTVDYLLTGTVIENIPVYEMLGLSQNTVENMRLIKDGYFEDSPYMLPMLDRLLGARDFYTTLEKAAYWTQAADDDMEEKRDYYEFKAMQALQSYLLEFLGQNFSEI